MEWDDAYFNDKETLSVFADYVEDNGDDALTKGIRYCIDNGVQPYKADVYNDQYCWTNRRYEDRMNSEDSQSPPNRDWFIAIIPTTVFDGMPHNFTNQLMIDEVRAFQTAIEAYDALGKALRETPS